MSRTKQNIMYRRNPIYVFYALAAAAIFLISTIFAQRPTIGPIERALFNAFYVLPDTLTPVFIFITTLGSMVTILVVAAVLTVRHRLDIVVRILAASSVAYGLVQICKTLVERGRPETFFENVIPKIQAEGYGFSSSHAAVSIAAGLTLALYAPRTYRKWILFCLVLIGCSRMILGVSFPLDVIGGWAIGIFCYSTASLALGSKHLLISSKHVARKLTAAGMQKVKLKSASVDARGSVPFFGEYKGGKIFVKVFNQDNNAADWLFKLTRRLRYRRLEDEVPSLTPKRAIEHEAYLTMLAKYGAKARVPEVLGIYKIGTNSYAMVTLRIDAVGLNKMKNEQITDTMLKKIWKQIRILHKHNIIHKDLRTANVMIENKTKLPWIIDFGFSECAVDQTAFYKDTVEFIASSATKVGAKRAVASAVRTLGQHSIEEALPYMQYAALSGATTTDLKAQKGLLDEIRSEMYAATKIKPRKLKKVRLSRILSPRDLKR